MITPSPRPPSQTQPGRQARAGPGARPPGGNGNLLPTDGKEAGENREQDRIKGGSPVAIVASRGQSPAMVHYRR
jgi:hypothetical protein